MPLLNKKPFERIEIPTDINREAKVYYLEASNEIFDNYDDFFERQIQLNSTVWSCEFTGKTGLTFFEAQQSESDAMKALDDFPKYLEIPILFIVKQFTARGRFDDLLNDVASFMKDRYFIGEECSYTEGGKRRRCKIIGCSTIEEQDWKNDNIDKPSTASKELSMTSPEKMRYSVQILDDVISATDEMDDGLREGVLSSSLSRGKNVASKPKLKLFLKNSCYINVDRYDVKDRFLRDGVITSLDWPLVMGGSLPAFPCTPMLQRGRQPKTPVATPSSSTVKTEANGVDTPSTPAPAAKPNTPGGRSQGRGKMSEKKRLKITLQQEELAAVFDNARRFDVDLTKYEQTSRFLPPNEIADLKRAIRMARQQGRESNRELKKQKIKEKVKAKYEWAKKREDLECEDLRPLPSLAPLQYPDWITDSDFEEYITILQFFNAFEEVLPIKEIRGSSRVSLSDIIIAIRCNDPQRSPYADLMKILLSARTDRADEEDGDEADLAAKEEVSLIQLQNCDPIHPVHGDEIRKMNRLHEDIRLTHGESVRHLPVDWMTLTESLRLVLKTSGYYSGISSHRHRLFGRGNFKGYEDAGYLFRLENPKIMETLKSGTVFDLEPKDRLALMNVIIGQLLSYNKLRSLNDERLTQLWELKRELRKLRSWDQTQEQEAKDARLVREYELDNLGVDEKPPALSPSSETARLKTHLKAVREDKRTDRDELEQILLGGVTFIEMGIEDIISARELQKERVQSIEDNLLSSIYDLTAVAGKLHIGRDRAYRNYFMLESIPALIVENPTELDRIGECGEATPIADCSDYGSVEAARHFVLACSGNMSTCSVHGEGRKKRPRWSHVDSVEMFEQILGACNPRGFRENDLSDELTYNRGRIVEIIEKVKSKTESGQFASLFMLDQQDPVNLSDSIDWHQEMRELLLDLEEKIEQGQMGRLPGSVNREKWRSLLLETGDVTPLIDYDVTVKGSENEVIWTREQLVGLTELQKLSLAFLQLVQGISLKFYRKPFVFPNSNEAGSYLATRVFLNWQRWLLNCESISALALFLSTLEPAILWDKSRLQGKCRLCRRKGAAQSLVLCTDCNQCFHLACVFLPNDQPAPMEWFCSDCGAIRRKKVAAEKRKANREAAAAEATDMYEEENSQDENSLCETDLDTSTVSLDIARTSSGRAVKKVVYKEKAVPALPPLKASRRNSSRSNGHHAQSGVVYNEDDDYDSEASLSRSVKRSSKRKASSMSHDNTPVRTRDLDSQSIERIGRLEQIVRDAMKEPYAWPFLEPVDAKQVPDYYEIITRPVDLRTIINRIKNHHYDSAEEVRSDMYQLVANCKEYNEEGSDIYECSEQIEDFFEERLKLVFDNKKRRR